MEIMLKKESNIVHATKWSSITEVVAKLVTPLSNMILARILTPEDFGIVATATMVFSFADIFTDSGFQKYLIQHEFVTLKDCNEDTTVAFWTNLSLSIIFWCIISVFSEKIAITVGNTGLGKVIIVACFSLPITSFSSIQMALFRRDFDFKTLFYVRMAAIVIPIIITIPLAYLWHSYWSIIIGTICGNMTNAIVLTLCSKWKPHFFFSFKRLKKMLSFSLWSLVESVTIWLTNYIGIFIVGAYLSNYYLGIYKTSMNTVNQIMNLVTAATTTVLFSTLSRQQNNPNEFQKTFFLFQRNVGLLIVPMGVGTFLYRELVTKILLGNQWNEAAGFIGLWALVNSVKILLSNYCFEAYRAVGKPRVSVFVQFTQLMVLVPLIFYGVRHNFQTLYIIRCLVSLELIVVNLITIKLVLKISPIKMILNILPEIFATFFMAVIGMVILHLYNSIIWEFISIIFCIIIYFITIMIIPNTRNQYFPILKCLYSKIKV